MSKSKQSRAKSPVIITVITFGLAGFLTATLAAPGSNFAHAKARTLANQSMGEGSSDEALADLKLAHWLDPRQPDYSLKLANIYLEKKQPQQAIRTLRSQGGQDYQIAVIQFQMGKYHQAIDTISQIQTSESYLLQAKAYLEIGDYDQAQTEAQRVPPKDRQADLVLAYCAALQGQGSAAIVQAAGESAGSEDIAAIAAGGLPLAFSLYNHSLLAAAGRVLQTASHTNAQTFELLANIELAHQPPNTQQLQTARDNLKQAAAISPADITIHQHLLEVLERLGDSQGADQEDTLVRQLQSGKI